MFPFNRHARYSSVPSTTHSDNTDHNEKPQEPPRERSEPKLKQPERDPNPQGAGSPIFDQSSQQDTHKATTQSSSPPRHPELRSAESLHSVQYSKVYFSGPMVRKVERTSSGGKPKPRGIEWVDVWVQIMGASLCIWDMKAVNQASKEGREESCSYLNLADAYVYASGSAFLPSETNLYPHKNVFALTTAGDNLVLFSCPDNTSLVSCVSAIRLAGWEKSRLEEIYTAHLLRVTLNTGGLWANPPSTLVKGRMEGWGFARIAGQTNWERVWMTISAGDKLGSPSEPSRRTSTSMRRISKILNDPKDNEKRELSLKPSLKLYHSRKDRDKEDPFFILRDVFQAFGIYPERPELIRICTLIKVEGTMQTKDPSGDNNKEREGWTFLMPEVGKGKLPVGELLRWMVGLHDAFQLYGRPNGYIWSTQDPKCMMFAYPFGPQKPKLFLDRELAETLDLSDHRRSSIRSHLAQVIVERANVEQMNLPSPKADTGPAPVTPQHSGAHEQRRGSPISTSEATTTCFDCGFVSRSDQTCLSAATTAIEPQGIHAVLDRNAVQPQPPLTIRELAVRS